MSGTQTAGTTSTQPAPAVIANGKRAHRAKPAEQPAGQAASGQTETKAPRTEAQKLAAKANALKAQETMRARRAAATRDAQAGAQGSKSVAGATARQPAGTLTSPVIQDLVRMLPAQGATFSQRQAVTWLEACAANIRLIYGFAGPITVTGTPAT